MFSTIAEPTTPTAPVVDSTTTDSLTLKWAEPEGYLERYVIAVDGGETKYVYIYNHTLGPYILFDKSQRVKLYAKHI